MWQLHPFFFFFFFLAKKILHRSEYLVSVTFDYDGIYYQSGTKPNLVAKILATKFGFVPDWLWLRINWLTGCGLLTTHGIADLSKQKSDIDGLLPFSSIMLEEKKKKH